MVLRFLAFFYDFITGVDNFKIINGFFILKLHVMSNAEDLLAVRDDLLAIPTEKVHEIELIKEYSAISCKFGISNNFNYRDVKNLILLITSIFILASCKNNKIENQEYNPDAVELNDKGVTLSLNFKNDSALILFDQAIAIDSTYYLPHSNKIGIYLLKKDYEQTISECEKVIKLKPNLAEVWFFAGLLYEHKGNHEKALRYYNISIQIFTERINDPSKLDDIGVNKLNRALSKKFIGDKSYLDDFNELSKIEKYAEIVSRFSDQSKDEIMNELIK